MPTTSPERVFTDAAVRSPNGALRVGALVALTAVAGGLWFARAAEAGPHFTFLWWNLFLAWVPWVVSSSLRHTRRLFWPLFAVWLAFFPNAPYLLTDLIHLKPRAGAPLWFDVLLFASFAFAGCAVGWDSLWDVQRELGARLGVKPAAAIVTACVALTGVGVFLGRFERLNSWELVTDPLQVAITAANTLAEPKALVFSAAFALFVGAGYLFSRPAISAS